MDENHIDLLIDVNHHLKDVHDKILSKLSIKEGLIAHPKHDTSVIIMRRKIKKARAILHCSVIPKSKSVKRLQQAKRCRVGSKAEKQKRVQCYVYIIMYNNHGMF